MCLDDRVWPGRSVSGGGPGRSGRVVKAQWPVIYYIVKAVQ